MSPWSDNFLAFDTETTGLGEDARIVEIAVVRFENQKPVDTWETFLNPAGIDWELESVKGALAVNGLSQVELEDAPTFAEVFPVLSEKLSAAPVWVAHNTEFDMRMIAQERARLPIEAEDSVSKPNPKLVLDTMLWTTS